MTEPNIHPKTLVQYKSLIVHLHAWVASYIITYSLQNYDYIVVTYCTTMIDMVTWPHYDQLSYGHLKVTATNCTIDI